MTRPPLNIITIGHQYHGKHTLADAIVRLWHKQKKTVTQSKRTLEDRAAQAEDARFEVGELHYASPARSYVQIDCVGRAERVVERALARVTPVAGAILIVSANISEKNATVQLSRDHLIAAAEAGLRNLVVFMDDCAAIDDPELLDLAENSAREEVHREQFDEEATPFIRGDVAGAVAGDATWEAAIEKLIAALDRHVPG